MGLRRCGGAASVPSSHCPASNQFKLFPARARGDSAATLDALGTAAVARVRKQDVACVGHPYDAVWARHAPQGGQVFRVG